MRKFLFNHSVSRRKLGGHSLYPGLVTGDWWSKTMLVDQLNGLLTSSQRQSDKARGSRRTGAFHHQASARPSCAVQKVEDHRGIHHGRIVLKNKCGCLQGGINCSKAV